MESDGAWFTPLKCGIRKKCCVPSCCSVSASSPHLRFHSLPREGEIISIKTKKQELKCWDRREYWLRVLEITEPVTKKMLVCSRHFLRSDYHLPDHAAKQRHLKRVAVPSQNLPRKPPAAKDYSSECNIRWDNSRDFIPISPECGNWMSVREDEREFRLSQQLQERSKVVTVKKEVCEDLFPFYPHDEIITDDLPSQEMLMPVPVKLLEVSTGKEFHFNHPRHVMVDEDDEVKELDPLGTSPDEEDEIRYPVSPVLREGVESAFMPVSVFYIPQEDNHEDYEEHPHYNSYGEDPFIPAQMVEVIQDYSVERDKSKEYPVGRAHTRRRKQVFPPQSTTERMDKPLKTITVESPIKTIKMESPLKTDVGKKTKVYRSTKRKKRNKNQGLLSWEATRPEIEPPTLELVLREAKDGWEDKSKGIMEDGEIENVVPSGTGNKRGRNETKIPFPVRTETQVDTAEKTDSDPVISGAKEKKCVMMRELKNLFYVPTPKKYIKVDKPKKTDSMQPKRKLGRPKKKRVGRPKMIRVEGQPRNVVLRKPKKDVLVSSVPSFVDTGIKVGAASSPKVESNSNPVIRWKRSIMEQLQKSAVVSCEEEDTPISFLRSGARTVVKVDEASTPKKDTVPMVVKLADKRKRAKKNKGGRQKRKRDEDHLQSRDEGTFQIENIQISAVYSCADTGINVDEVSEQKEETDPVNSVVYNLRNGVVDSLGEDKMSSMQGSTDIGFNVNDISTPKVHSEPVNGVVEDSQNGVVGSTQEERISSVQSCTDNAINVDNTSALEKHSDSKQVNGVVKRKRGRPKKKKVGRPKLIRDGEKQGKEVFRSHNPLRGVIKSKGNKKQRGRCKEPVYVNGAEDIHPNFENLQQDALNQPINSPNLDIVQEDVLNQSRISGSLEDVEQGASSQPRTSPSMDIVQQDVLNQSSISGSLENVQQDASSQPGSSLRLDTVQQDAINQSGDSPSFESIHHDASSQPNSFPSLDIVQQDVLDQSSISGSLENVQEDALSQPGTSPRLDTVEKDSINQSGDSPSFENLPQDALSQPRTSPSIDIVQQDVLNQPSISGSLENVQQDASSQPGSSLRLDTVQQDAINQSGDSPSFENLQQDAVSRISRSPSLENLQEDALSQPNICPSPDMVHQDAINHSDNSPSLDTVHQNALNNSDDSPSLDTVHQDAINHSDDSPSLDTAHQDALNHSDDSSSLENIEQEAPSQPNCSPSLDTVHQDDLNHSDDSSNLENIEQEAASQPNSSLCLENSQQDALNQPSNSPSLVMVQQDSLNLPSCSQNLEIVPQDVLNQHSSSSCLDTMQQVVINQPSDYPKQEHIQQYAFNQASNYPNLGNVQQGAFNGSSPNLGIVQQDVFLQPSNASRPKNAQEEYFVQPSYSLNLENIQQEVLNELSNSASLELMQQNVYNQSGCFPNLDNTHSAFLNPSNKLLLSDNVQSVILQPISFPAQPIHFPTQHISFPTQPVSFTTQPLSFTSQPLSYPTQSISFSTPYHPPFAAEFLQLDHNPGAYLPQMQDATEKYAAGHYMGE